MGDLIGGPGRGAEHEGLAVPPPNAMPIEYNLLIDIVAGQVVFTDSDLTVWQVPRDVWVVEEIPANDRGKINRHALAENYLARRRPS